MSEKYSIREVEYETVLPIWQHALWPGRAGIEPYSAMMYAPDSDVAVIDTGNANLPQVFAAAFHGPNVIGVNSGHMCTDGSFRSRGLWVHSDYRGEGLGLALLQFIIDAAQECGAASCWSYPRYTSKKTYTNAGFSIVGDWRSSDTSDKNAYCFLNLNK